MKAESSLRRIADFLERKTLTVEYLKTKYILGVV